MYKCGLYLSSPPRLFEMVLVGGGVTSGAGTSWMESLGSLSHMDALQPIVLLSFKPGLDTGLSRPLPWPHPRNCCPAWVKGRHAREKPFYGRSLASPGFPAQRRAATFGAGAWPDQTTGGGGPAPSIPREAFSRQDSLPTPLGPQRESGHPSSRNHGKGREKSQGKSGRSGHQHPLHPQKDTRRDGHTPAFIVSSRRDTASNSKKINLQKQGFSAAAWLEPERGERCQSKTKDPHFRFSH